jgi:hypothetical protein
VAGGTASKMVMVHPNLSYYSPSATKQGTEPLQVDICVYGGSASGVVAALAAHRMGRSVVLLVNGLHLGGLTTGGLGATDFGDKQAIGGISREFYRALGRHYGCEERWYFEPHVASQIIADWLRAAGIEPRYQSWLDRVELDGSKIRSLHCENGLSVQADVFIDATYEGDLLAAAGVSHVIGRECSEAYDELFNGVFFGHPNHNFQVAIDPYRIPGDSSSGLIPEVSEEPPGRQGDGDHRIQAYNFRLCLTSQENNRVPFSAPPDYDPYRYELLRRYLEAGYFDALSLSVSLPNGKTDTNNCGAFSTDYIGGNHRWPQAGYEEREKIFQDHVNYVAGLLFYLQNDAPDYVRKQVADLGYASDEFLTTGHFPPQLYIREARRMVSDYVITEHDCLGAVRAPDPIGLGAYGMDSHNCQRVVRHGRVVNEGNVEIKGFPPYPISYQTIVPRRGECGNLLVPVCLSASHIAYGSLRMEPVFMVLGESAALAADLAIKLGCDMQDIPYKNLRECLLEAGQVLDIEVRPDEAQVAVPA